MSEDQLIDARVVPLGGVRGTFVNRTLPHRDLPTIGAWCFVDHFGPEPVDMSVLPHPHTGLQTVTWPLAGTIRHRDSLGSDVVLQPGELNLMTSGQAVSHSEFGTLEGGPVAHGIQLWVALPDSDRFGPPAFEHLADLPRTEGEGWQAIVLIGDLAGAVSPANVFSPLIGAQIELAAGIPARIPVQPGFEHGVLAASGGLLVEGNEVAHRQLQYLAPGRSEIVLQAQEPTTVLLIGGEPFDEDIVMWWNFIGRTHEDIVEARDLWESERAIAGDSAYGRVDGHGLDRIPAPPLPNVRLTPRRRRPRSS